VLTHRFVMSGLIALAIVAVIPGCVTRQHAPVVERSNEPPAAKKTPAEQKEPESTKREPSPAAPGEPKPQVHLVKKGETLYGIARQYNLNYQELAGWNRITDVNAIREGDQLSLIPPGAREEGGVVVAPMKIDIPPEGKPVEGGAGAPPPPPTGNEPPPAEPQSGAPLKTEPKAAKVPYSDQAFAKLHKPGAEEASRVEPKPEVKQEAKVEPRQDNESLQWVWPASGRIVSAFSESSKGLDIAGAQGQAVLACADGRVSYIGNSLRGYGKMVVIIHNKTHLSLYAHNSAILVKEGQSVSRGQKIAEMGNSDSADGAVKLHFEIRRLGKPVDPLKYLPPNERAS
jgi:lipoprotein NlpD